MAPNITNSSSVDVKSAAEVVTTAAASTLTPTASLGTTDDPYDDFFERSFLQQIIVTKVVGLLSAMGSAYIIYNMVINVKDAADRKKKLDRTFQRLLLGLCISDFIASVSYFLGSWYVLFFADSNVAAAIN